VEQEPSEGGVATLELSEKHKEVSSEPQEAPWFSPPNVSATDPVEILRPELSFEARMLENMLISQFDGQDLSLPPLPRIPDAVLKQLRNPQCNFTRIAQLISEDQVAAAAVLRTVNSPIYGGISKITSLPQAVTRLGINPLRTLMMHQSLRAAMFLTGKGNHELAQIFWRRSLAGAFIMRGLASFTRLDPEECLVIGLLHDVGNVVVLRVVSEEKNFGIPLPDYSMFEYLCYETHQEFGELVANEWNMATHLKELIQNHHTYPEPNDPLRTQRLMLILTDMITPMLGYAPPAAYNLLQARPARDLGLSDSEHYAQFLTKLPSVIEDSISWF